MRSPADLRQRGLNGWRAAERLFDAAFGARANPLRQLGSLGFLAFWLLAVSGIYLYVVFDTSVAGAWASIDALAREQPWAGGLLRSLHRYAADAFVVLLALHTLREWLHGHYRGFRRFSWLTGVPLVVFAFIGAIGGFWLEWDRLAQFSALATAEWLDALPLLATPLARNFLAAGAVGDRLFSLFVFVHVAVPLLLLFGLWFHIQRITRAAVFPPRSLALGTIATLVLLALVMPVVSHEPADLATVPQALRLDWMLLFVHPLADAASPEAAWALVCGGLLLLFGLPFLPQPAALARPPVAEAVAVVDAANCNGCRRCFADCPYAAITMVPHPNGRTGRQLARVDADLCAACGICAGACPSSTPFRSATELVTGIDMPQLTVGTLRRQLRLRLATLQAGGVERPIVVFGCDHGARSAALAAPDVAAFNLLCAGQLPPSFVEYALRDGAAGVLVAGCRDGGCEFRLGMRWTAERLQGLREPHLRANVPRERLALAEADAGEDGVLTAALGRLREQLRHAAAPAGPPPKVQHG
jgi:coenzyme F420-reducing hydrogenase delta subunit/ferredoxin